MASRHLIRKNPTVDLKKKVQKWFEAALIVSLLFLSGLFYAFQKFESSTSVERVFDEGFTLEPPPKTEQLKQPLAPELPKIPIEAEEDSEMPEDFALQNLFFNKNAFDDSVPPPPDVEAPIVPFIELSSEPKLIKRVQPVYPQLAKRANIQGSVVVKVLINTKGDVEDWEVMSGHPLLKDAAVEAAKQFKFKPAKQRDRLVKVWMSIPFHFRLK